MTSQVCLPCLDSNSCSLQALKETLIPPSLVTAEMDEILSPEDKKANNFYTILGCDPSSSVSDAHPGGPRKGYVSVCLGAAVLLKVGADLLRLQLPYRFLAAP